MQAREKTLGAMRKLKADAQRTINERKAAAQAAEARAAELAAEGAALRARIQVCCRSCVLPCHEHVNICCCNLKFCCPWSNLAAYQLQPVLLFCDKIAMVWLLRRLSRQRTKLCELISKRCSSNSQIGRQPWPPQPPPLLRVPHSHRRSSNSSSLQSSRRQRRLCQQRLCQQWLSAQSHH